MTSHPLLPLRTGFLGGAAWLLTIAAPSPSARAQTPVLEVRFNSASDADLQHGATFGTGVSGKPDDKCYSADPGTAADAQKLPLASTGSNNPVTNLDEFTVTAWYKVRNTPRNDATLFDALGTVMIWEEKSNTWVLRIDTKPAADTKASSYWFRMPKAPQGAWAVPEQWIFVAATWKRSEKKATFYQGTASASADPAGSVSRPEEVDPLNERANAKRIIGNNHGKSDRPFDGDVDNFRFYDKAISREAVEKIRQADLSNTALKP